MEGYMTIDEWIEHNDHIKLACPECADYYDAPTTCTTCWCEGGGGKISLKRFIEDVVIPEITE